MRAHGTIYLVRPDWVGEDEDIDQATVKSYESARSFLRVAPELWRLAGNDKCAASIDALLNRLYERDEIVMTAAEIEELLRLLDGIEDALVGTIVDNENWHVLPEMLPGLWTRTKSLHLEDSGGDLAFEISGMSWLRNILREARDKDLLVALD